MLQLDEAKVATNDVVVPTKHVVGLSDITEENLCQRREMLYRFAEEALATYSTCQLSRNHLLRLIQLNVVNSLTRNSTILGLDKDWLLCSAMSPFCIYGPQHSSGPKLPQCPSNMVPTRLQQSIPHHPWVDLFPLPRMRDNLLTAVCGMFTPEQEQQLWDDLIEPWGSADWAGMIVWGEPWDPNSWEVTLPFLRRWGWLLTGCNEILESTNRWRQQRGEKPINIQSWPKGQPPQVVEID
jgi:hypothetical protein